MPFGIEVFGNQPTAVNTSGAMTSGTSSITVTYTNGSTWPVASTSVTPNTYFRVIDPAAQAEIILVTVAAGGSGTDTWTLTRGYEGTAVAHAANCVFQQVISAGTLQSFKQAPSVNTTTAATVTSTTEIVLASYVVPPADLAAGTVFEIMAFGPMSFNSLTGTTHPVMTINLYWGGSGSINGTFTTTNSVKLAFMKTGTNLGAFGTVTTLIAGSSWDVNGTIVLQTATSTHTNMNLYMSGLTNNSLAADNITGQTTNTGSTGIASSTAISISGATPNTIFLTGVWTSAVNAQTFSAVGQTIYRVA